MRTIDNLPSTNCTTTTVLAPGEVLDMATTKVTVLSSYLSPQLALVMRQQKEKICKLKAVMMVLALDKEKKE